MSGETWRSTARAAVADVLRRTQGQTEKEIRKALHDAYPFGEREYYPYKVWLDEIARQRKTLKGRMSKPKPKDKRGHNIIIDPRQERLL